MNGKWLPPAQLTASGLPVLLPGEVERFIISAVDLEPETNLAPLHAGRLHLTTHRLIWIDEPSSTSAFAIPLTTIIDAAPYKKKSIKSMFHSPRVRVRVSVSPEGRVGEKGTRSEAIIIVLRGKNDPESFYGRLMEVVKQRAWEAEERDGKGAGSDGSQRGSGSGEGSSRPWRAPVVGVSGILRQEQERWESTDKSMQEAFHDLNALMV